VPHKRETIRQNNFYNRLSNLNKNFLTYIYIYIYIYYILRYTNKKGGNTGIGRETAIELSKMGA
jgi:hypothetical protein